jgi:tRNA-dihydrouridine synthase A
MLGRAAYDNPWMFATVDEQFFEQPMQTSRRKVVETMIAYAEQVLRDDPRARLGHIARHLQNLFTGEPGARGWRRAISEQAFKADASPQLLLAAIPPGA